MKSLKVLLIGQPNVGKSSLLNALVGPRVVISNYPGTTVEITKAKKVFDNTEISFFDTPGIYSVSDRSEEEKVTEKALFEMNADRVIILADAISLERSLYMILQVLEAKIPVVIALNFVEDAEKKGIKINYQELEKFLDIPVVPINPLTRKGINKLVEATLKIKEEKRQGFKVGYDDHIEKAISKISTQIESNLPKRFIAVRVLEGDEDFYKYLINEKAVEEVKPSNLSETTIRGETSSNKPVYLIKNGEIISKVKSSSGGTFAIIIKELEEGEHSLIVEACRNEERKHCTSKGIAFLIDQTPPEQPQINSLPSKTDNEKIIIEGNAEPRSTIKIFLNKEKETTTEANSQGIFSQEVTLQEGENSIFVIAYDRTGNKSQPSEAVYVQYNKSPRV